MPALPEAQWFALKRRHTALLDVAGFDRFLLDCVVLDDEAPHGCEVVVMHDSRWWEEDVQRWRCGRGVRFQAYMTDILVPALRPGDTVVMDIRDAVTRFKPDECRNYLAVAGYDAVDSARTETVLGTQAATARPLSWSASAAHRCGKTEQT